MKRILSIFLSLVLTAALLCPAAAAANETDGNDTDGLYITLDPGHGGNGAGGEICADILIKLGATVIPMFCEPDGDFPNHHPDPVVEANMQALMARVKEEKADLGIGLDGDADRLGIVDPDGRLLFGDEVLSLYARELLTRKPGSTVIADVN